MTVVASVTGFPTAQAHPIEVHSGDILLLEGANGSGKTSLLRVLAGLSSPLPHGPVMVEGTPPASLVASRLAHTVRVVHQDARDGLVGLTGDGELRLRGLSGSVPLPDRPIATLSSGEARQAALAVAAAQDGRLLLLDEPAEGLDAAHRAALTDLIVQVARRGCAVVVCDHSGLVAPHATRRLDLSPQAAAPLSPLPPAAGAPVLVAPAAHLRGCPLPALRLGPGLHLLTGPNGCGKSTLLLRLAGLLPADGVTIRGAPPRPGQNVRLLLPRARDHFHRATLAEELEGTPAPWLDLFSCPTGALLPREVSGGQLQRAALAKTFGQPSPLYLLDEPEAHLDAAGREALVAAIAHRLREGSTLVVASHDAPLSALAHDTVSMGLP
ncbi:MAG: ATP-binding cassette domain-containing protein [Thermoplasmatota archaeon]